MPLCRNKTQGSPHIGIWLSTADGYWKCHWTSCEIVFWCGSKASTRSNSLFPIVTDTARTSHTPSPVSVGVSPVSSWLWINPSFWVLVCHANSTLPSSFPVLLPVRSGVQRLQTASLWFVYVLSRVVLSALKGPLRQFENVLVCPPTVIVNNIYNDIMFSFFCFTQTLRSESLTWAGRRPRSMSSLCVGTWSLMSTSSCPQKVIGEAVNHVTRSIKRKLRWISSVHGNSIKLHI